MHIPIIERTPFRCAASAGHPLSVLAGLLTLLLLYGELARASVASDINMVPHSVSPNAEFGFADCHWGRI